MKIFFVGDTENKHTVLKNRYMSCVSQGREGYNSCGIMGVAIHEYPAPEP